jgi:hypothetical protein
VRLDTCPFGVITVYFGVAIFTGLRAVSIPGRGFSERTTVSRTYAAYYLVGAGVKRSCPEADRSPPSSKGKVHPREATKAHRGVEE